MITVNANGKMKVANKLEKKYLDVIASGRIEEGQIVGMRSALRRNKIGITEILKAIGKQKGGVKLSDSQNKKGYDYCIAAWRGNRGVRKNNPFDGEQADILADFSHFTLVGLANVATDFQITHGFNLYYPVYRCYSNSGSYFDYYYNLGAGTWHVLGTQIRGISKKTRYVHTDGWRGYSEPVNAVGGANDTGGWEDSPCPSDVCEKELNGFKEKLKEAGIRFTTMTCESSNVFCVHRYVLVAPKDHEKAYAIAKEFRDGDTQLFYAVERAKAKA